MPNWTRQGERTLLHTPVFDVAAVGYHHAKRSVSHEFVVIQAPDWVVAVAVTTRQEIVLVRQFRFGIDAIGLELPGGIMDEGETPVQAAVRELAEETGYVGTSARVLGFAHPNPAIQSNRNHIVLIEGAERTGAVSWDEHEELETLVLPVADALQAARDGRITHALMLNALFLFEGNWRQRPGGGGAGV